MNIRTIFLAITGLAGLSLVAVLFWSVKLRRTGHELALPSSGTIEDEDGPRAQVASGVLSRPAPSEGRSAEAPAGLERDELPSNPEAKSEAGQVAEDSAYLDRVARTFLTETPDSVGLLDALTRLAGHASIIEESVKIDAGTGVVSGVLSLGTDKLRGTFLISDDTTIVDFVAGAPEEGFHQRQVTLSFDNEEPVGGYHATVQFHPGATALAGTVQKRIVGWNVNVTHNGGRLEPMIMKPASTGSGVYIGRPAEDDLPEDILREDPAAWDMRPYTMWRTLTATHRAR